MCCRAEEEVLADAFEALVGAVYLDSGIEAASRFLIGLAEVSVVCTLLQSFCTEHCQSAFSSLQPVNCGHGMACVPIPCESKSSAQNTNKVAGLHVVNASGALL